MHTLKRTALVITVAGIMLVSGACSSGSSDGSKNTSTTPATTTPKPKPGAIGKQNAKVAAYCKAYAPVKAKAKLTDLKSTAATVALVKPVVAVAPPAVKEEAQYVLDTLTTLASASDDAAFAKQKAVVMKGTEMKKAYVRLSYFNLKNCK